MNEKRKAKEKRIYELSQVTDAIPTEPGYQIPFRHLCNLLQIHSGDIEAVLNTLSDITPSQKERLRTRCKCAWAWITTFAPEEFRWALCDADNIIEVSDAERKAIKELALYVDEHIDAMSEKEFSNFLYKAAEDNGLESGAFFGVLYRVLINRERGPKLAGFIKACGKDKILTILNRY